MIGVLGINHTVASQDVRQLFSFTKEDIVAFWDLLQESTSVTELVVLSTCNRTEIYYYSDRACRKHTKQSILEVLHEFKNCHEQHTDLFYHHRGIETVKHLFRVTSGMDSVVIGEYQIVSQVKEAYVYCTEKALTKAVLMRLFQKAFETSKRVRTETKVQQGATSISYVATDLCAKIYTDLTTRTVLIIGSGETGRLALQNLKHKGISKVYVANRTFENALALTDELGGTAIPFEDFMSYVPQCDIVIVATGAQNYLISKEDIEAGMKGRDNQCQVFIDLSVPRNIEKTVDEIEEVKLYCVDDLQNIVNSSVDMRMQSIDQAQLIVDEVADEYMEWFDMLTLRPLIKSITSNLMKLRDAESAGYKSADDAKKSEIIDEYTNRITQKYIGQLIKNLKEISKNNPSTHSLNVIQELFDFKNS